jgi:hypothetical protein
MEESWEAEMSLEEGGSSPEQRIEGPQEEVVPASEVIASEGDAKSLWNRRTLFKSAALGTAAAAMYEGGRGLFSPLIVYADTLSSLNCTANDVRIVGPGQVINEPCDCTGTFNAQVRFRIINNTGTNRYCVTVHFCPGTLPNGTVFNPGDVQIGTIPPKSDAFYTVTIPNYPCGSGLVCFGACGPGFDEDTGLPDCSFPKGVACPTGECCTTITWDVNQQGVCPQPHDRIITSKCRHQQVCIQGRGGTTLDCDTVLTGVQTTCAVECGATTTVRLCTTEAASLGPFTFVLHVPGQPDQTFTGDGPCHDFTVGPITETTTITGDVTSSDNCTKSASVTLTTSPITVTLGVSGNEGCTLGNLTFTATLGTACTDPNGATFAFSVDGIPVQTGSSNTYNYPADPDTVCHTVSVVATCGACVSNMASTTVSQCVTTTTPC